MGFSNVVSRHFNVGLPDRKGAEYLAVDDFDDSLEAAFGYISCNTSNKQTVTLYKAFEGSTLDAVWVCSSRCGKKARVM